MAAFAKRLCRLALVAGAEDAAALLRLLAALLQRHPALKRMVHAEDEDSAVSEYTGLVLTILDLSLGR